MRLVFDSIYSIYMFYSTVLCCHSLCNYSHSFICFLTIFTIPTLVFIFHESQSNDIVHCQITLMLYFRSPVILFPIMQYFYVRKMFSNCRLKNQLFQMIHLCNTLSFSVKVRKSSNHLSFFTVVFLIHEVHFKCLFNDFRYLFTGCFLTEISEIGSLTNFYGFRFWLL